MKKIIFCALVITGFVWSACNDDNDNKAINQTDKDFLINAAYGNHAEIDAGQLAISKSSSDSVRNFGQMMVSEHTAALDELKSIAKDLNTNVPDAADSKHRQLKQQLMTMSGAQFDSAYIQSQISDHQKTDSLFESEASNGKEQRVKDYANKYLPNIRTHLQRANSIASQLNNNNNNGGTGTGTGDGTGTGGTGTGGTGTGDGGTGGTTGGGTTGGGTGTGGGRIGH
jgi:putative membrane protein